MRSKRKISDVLESGKSLKFINFSLLERHSRARTSGSGYDQLLLAAGVVGIQHEREVRSARLHCINLVQCVAAALLIPKRARKRSCASKRCSQHSASYTFTISLHLSISLSLSLSLVSPVPHLSRQSEFIHDHGAFPRLRACERALLLEQTAHQTIRACNRCNRSEASRENSGKIQVTPCDAIVRVYRLITSDMRKVALRNTGSKDRRCLSRDKVAAN